jgi:hypothetical protein
MARCARCDVRWRAAVFVASDETTMSKENFAFDAFRRLLLQIGGANIAGASRAFELDPSFLNNDGAANCL